MADRTVRVRLEAVTDQFSKGMRQAANETRTHGSAMAKSARENRAEWTTAGLAIGAAGAAITLGLRKAGNEAAAFQATLMRSTTLVGISTEEMQRMGQAALGMGETGRGPQELGRALFFAQSAGLRGAEALAVVEASAKAAAIGLGDTATVTDLVTSAVNAYGSEALSASGATDVLIGSVREGKAEASELAGAMGVVLPVASAMGVSFDQVGGAMAAMTRTGTDASMAATQLRAMLVSLLKPAEGAEQAMRDVGLSSEGLRRTIQEDGLFTALMQVRDAVGENDAAMAAIFPNIRALAGVMDLTGANSAETARIFERMTDTTGLLAEGFAQWSTTTEAAQQRFSASMEAARIALGEGLQPAMRAALDTGTGLAQAFVDLPEGLRQVVAIGGSAAGVTATLAGAFLLLLPRVLATKTAIQSLNISMAGGAKFAMNPYVLAVVAVVGQLSALARKKAEVQDRIEAFRQTLDETTGAVTQMTRALALQRLQDDGAISAARTLGLSMQTVTDAALGVPGAMAQVRAATDATVQSYKDGSGATRDQARAAFELLVALGDVIPELGAAADKARELAFATLESEVGSKGAAAEVLRLTKQAERYGVAAGNAASDGGDLTGIFGEQEEAAADAVSAIDLYIERLNTMHDPVLRLRDASDKLAEAQEDLREVQEDSESTAADLESALWGVFEAEVGVEAAALAFSQQGGQATLETLQKMVTQGRLTADQAAILAGVIGGLNATADDFRGEYDAEFNTNEHQVRNQLDRINQRANNAARRRTMLIDVKVSSVDHRVAVTASGSQSGFVSVPVHTGGEILGVGAVRRFHGGSDGPVGGFGRLASDEVPAILQTGEWVLSRQQVSMLQAALGSAMRFHGGGQVPAQSGGGGLTVQQTFAADVSRSTLAEARHQQRLAYLETR